MSYVKDPSSGIVINTDDGYYRSILALRESEKKSREMCKELDTLKNELSDIRSLMQQVLDGRKYG